MREVLHTVEELNPFIGSKDVMHFADGAMNVPLFLRTVGVVSAALLGSVLSRLSHD